MKKQCRDCRSMTNSQAPYCTACGYRFLDVPPLTPSSWRNSLVAVACGLIAASILLATFAKMATR
jgi:hypothetical protein